MNGVARALLKWVVVIFILPIYAVFAFTATVCCCIAEQIGDFCVLICDGIEGYERYERERWR